MGDSESIAVIRRFIEVCVRADPEEFAGYFNEDAVWWNAPWQSIRGPNAIREAMRQGAAQMSALPWEIRHIIADGNLVMTERIDHFLAGEKHITVPCVGVFELRDGRISAWRDYWDLRQFEAQLPQAVPAQE